MSNSASTDADNLNHLTDALKPLFIGPHAENDEFLEEMVTRIIRDHNYWRKNLYPEDAPSINFQDRNKESFVECQQRIQTQLELLSNKLKACVPYFSPHYMGKKSSDLMMTGALAKFIATLYSPENSAEIPCTVTASMEQEVIRDFTTMVGYSSESKVNNSFGHLTSDPATANLEALAVFRAIKYFPIAIRQGLKKAEIYIKHQSKAFKQPHDYNYWELSNFSIERVLHYRNLVYKTVLEQFGEEKYKEFSYYVEQHRIETLGQAQFFADNYQLRPPVVIVPSICTGKWRRTLGLLGMGHASLIAIPVNRSMQMDENELNRIIMQLRSQSIPVLAVVANLGTSEYGTIDPINMIIKLKNSLTLQDYSFYFHLDASWGGYLTSIFRLPGGKAKTFEQSRSQFSYFPTKRLFRDFEAVAEADSITLDTSRLGYLIRENGVYLCKDKTMANFQLLERFDFRDETTRPLYNFGVEYSRTGTSAAAAWVTHKVSPLDCDNMGLYITHAIKDAEYFFEKTKLLKKNLVKKAHVVVPFEPDSFVVTLAINPVGNKSRKRMNDFMKAIYKELQEKCGHTAHEYVCSTTNLELDKLSEEELKQLYKMLRLDQEIDNKKMKDSLVLLRHQFTNPWLSHTGQDNHIEKYIEYLEQLIERTLSNWSGQQG